MKYAVYAYLRCLENPSTYQCWPSYATIGKAIGRTKNTVMQYVDALSEKGLISTEPTSVLTKSRIKKNGNLRYTIRPIHEAVEIFTCVNCLRLNEQQSGGKFIASCPR